MAGAAASRRRRRSTPCSGPPIRAPSSRSVRCDARLLPPRDPVRACARGPISCTATTTTRCGSASRRSSCAAAPSSTTSHELWPDRNLRPEPRWWLVACEALFVRVADRVVTTSPAYAEVLARRYRITRADGGPEHPRATGGVATLRRAPGPTAPAGCSSTWAASSRTAGSSSRSAPSRWSPDVRLRLIGPARPRLPRRARAVWSARGRLRARRASPRRSRPDRRPRRAIRRGARPRPDRAGVPQLPAHAPQQAVRVRRSRGLPIVGSDLPMISSFVAEHGVGTTVNPGDVPAVARAMDASTRPGAATRGTGGPPRVVRALDRIKSWRSSRTPTGPSSPAVDSAGDGPAATDASGRPALLVVRNTFEHDARVLRAARPWRHRRRGHGPGGACPGRRPRTPWTATGSACTASGPRRRSTAVPTGPSRRGPRAPGRVAGSAEWGAGRSVGDRPPAPPSGPAASPVRRARPPARPVVTAARLLPSWDRARCAAPPGSCTATTTTRCGSGSRRALPRRSAVVYDSHELWPDRNLRPEPRWWLLPLRGALRARRRPRRDDEPGARRGAGAPLPGPEPVVVRNIPARRPRRRGRTRRRPSAARGARSTWAGSFGTAGSSRRSRRWRALPEARLRLIGPVGARLPRGARGLARAEGVAERVEFAAPVPPAKVVDARRGRRRPGAVPAVCLSHRLVPAQQAVRVRRSPGCRCWGATCR